MLLRRRSIWERRTHPTTYLQTDFWRCTFKNINFAFVDGAERSLNASIPQHMIPANNLSPLFPAFLRSGYTTGCAINLTNKTSLNVAYEHDWNVKLSNADLPNVSPTAPITAQHTQNNFVFNIQHRF